MNDPVIKEFARIHGISYLQAKQRLSQFAYNLMIANFAMLVSIRIYKHVLKAAKQ